MYADIIILTNKGIPEKQFIVVDPITALAQFDQLCEDELKEDYKDVVTAVDYGMRLSQANNYLNHFGKDIIWLEQVEVNQHVNDDGE